MKVVFDTNCVVSALVFKGRLSWLRSAWQSGQIIPLVSRPCADELIRVLYYPKFKLLPADVELLLAEYLPFAEVVKLPPRLPRVPHCRDRSDEIFPVAAVVGGADYVVSGDPDLRVLKNKFRISVVSPEEFREVLQL
ncbi:MAG: putative toxin-antitoxin system toxin component, PIN family [Candidatus Sumerlaeaceae bacterium]